jgi:beta-N-acetylhexosaminidase
MRVIRVLIFIFLLLPACRTTRDTVIPKVQKEAYQENIAMKFPESAPKTEPAGETPRVSPPPRPPIEESEAEEEGEKLEVDQELSEGVVEPEEIDWLTDQYLKKLTLDQKIGQRFITHIEGTEITKKTHRLIAEEGVSGVILYPWNVENPEQVKRLTSSLQREAAEMNPSILLFICVDQEGGRVNAFKFREVSHLPPPYFWARYRDAQYVESAAYIISKEIMDLGCNMNFAPVLDVYGIPDRTVIGDRSMGNDPEAVGQYGVAYIHGAMKAGIIPVVKHFPGHGYTNADSHHVLPVVELQEAELQAWDMKPFRMTIEQGADAVMTSHVLYKSLDPELPATLSSHILRDILREQYDFQGVVVSDGIAMGALSNNFDITETLKLSFKAGVDLILVHSTYELSDLKSEVHRLLRHGEITEKEIDEGVRRILELKLKYGLVPEA